MIWRRLWEIARAEWNGSDGEPLPQEAPTGGDVPPPGGRKSQVSAEEAKHYGVLELPPGASFGEVKAQYRRLMKRYHPDRFATDPQRRQDALEVARALNEAMAYFEARR